MKGPFTKSIRTPTYVMGRTWYRTDQDTARVPLPYSFTECSAKINAGYLQAVSSTFYNYLQGYDGSMDSNYKFPIVLNGAYQKFVEKLGQTATNGQNLIMYKQSVELLATLIKSARHPLVSLLKYYRKAKKDPKVNILSDLGGVWLMYHFGIETTMQDIYATIEALCFKIPTVKIYGQKTMKGCEILYRSTSYRSRDDHFVLCGRVGATVEITNPNLHLASTLGLINPTAIAWDLVPFSFLFDWFYDISTFVNSFTDFLGVTVTHPYYTKYGHGFSHEFFPARKPYSIDSEFQAAYMVRVLGLYRPIPVLRMPHVGISKVATSLSLLFQALKRYY